MTGYQLRRMDGLVSVEVDDWTVGAAQARIHRWPESHDPEGAFRPHEGRKVGALGEVVALRYLAQLPHVANDCGMVNHDIEVGGVTIDVKTKERTVNPRPDYECTVAAYLREVQHPDFYLFVTVVSDRSRGDGWDRFVRGWVHGTIRSDEFWGYAKYWGEGDVDPSNGWVCKESCWSVPSALLRPPLLVEREVV